MNKGLIVIYVIILINLLMTANIHGQLKTGKYSFWTTLVSTVFSLTLTWWALGWKFY